MPYNHYKHTGFIPQEAPNSYQDFEDPSRIFSTSQERHPQAIGSMK